MSVRIYVVVEIEVGDSNDDEYPTVNDWGAYKRLRDRLQQQWGGRDSATGEAHIRQVVELGAAGVRIHRWGP